MWNQNLSTFDSTKTVLSWLRITDQADRGSDIQKGGQASYLDTWLFLTSRYQKQPHIAVFLPLSSLDLL